jgi:hypothetical protein
MSHAMELQGHCMTSAVVSMLHCNTQAETVTTSNLDMPAAPAPGAAVVQTCHHGRY